MFMAVDEGFSYDGIISASGTGLEDRPRLTILLHDTVVRILLVLLSAISPSFAT